MQRVLRGARFGVKFFFLSPAGVDSGEAPLDAATNANGLLGDFNKDGVCVRAGEDAKCDPTAAFDRNFEREVASGTVGGDALARDTHAVDDHFNWDVARVFDACAFEVPEGFVGGSPNAPVTEPKPLSFGFGFSLRRAATCAESFTLRGASSLSSELPSRPWRCR